MEAESCVLAARRYCLTANPGVPAHTVLLPPDRALPDTFQLRNAFMPLAAQMLQIFRFEHVVDHI